MRIISFNIFNSRHSTSRLITDSLRQVVHECDRIIGDMHIASHLLYSAPENLLHGQVPGKRALPEKCLVAAICRGSTGQYLVNGHYCLIEDRY